MKQVKTKTKNNYMYKIRVYYDTGLHIINVHFMFTQLIFNLYLTYIHKCITIKSFI